MRKRGCKCFFVVLLLLVALLVFLFMPKPVVASACCWLESDCYDWEECNYVIGLCISTKTCEELVCPWYFTEDECDKDTECGIDNYCSFGTKEGTFAKGHTCQTLSLDECLACQSPLYDCDQNSGCETNINTDPNNCGSCGNACGAGYSCVAGACQYCGDGSANGPEQCDWGPTGHEFTCGAGYPSYFCTASCTWSGGSSCGYCGDNTKNGPEACDWGANNGDGGAWQHSSWISCGAYPNAEKRQRCSTGCQFEYEQDSCGVCGDGIVQNPPENCEGVETTQSGCSAGYQKTCSGCTFGSCQLIPGCNDDNDLYIDTSCGGTDCNDNDATKWQLLSGYTDSDSDGYGAGSVQSVCSGSSLPSGYSSVGGDCNNANANIYPGSCHADAISWPSTCATSTTGGCGSGTCTRVTNGVACGSGSRTCTAGDSKYCSGGNIYADTDTDKSCTAYCASGSCGSCTPPSCDTDLREVCDSCSGESSPSYLAADAVTDYESCQAGQTSCPSTSISDSCSGSSLTEYYCSGVDAVGTTFDCNSYDYQCSGTCGTGVNSCVGLDYGCSGGGNGYCGVVSSVDADASSSWCGGCSGQGVAWGIGGEVAQTACCGDDSSEHNRFRDCAGTACVDNLADKGCCDAPTDCVFNDRCFSDVNRAMLLVESPTADCKNLNNKNSCESGVAKKECVWNAALGKCTVSRASVQALGAGNLSAYADVDGDGSDEVCVAGSPGQWQETSGTISGTVRNITGVVQGAVVKVLGTGLSATTAADGSYSIGNVPSKAHDVVASKSEYDASTAFGVFVPDAGVATADFTLVRALGNCEDDCTSVGLNLCDASCHGKGLCWFYSDATKTACDGTFGIIEMPGGLTNVDCCKGQPYSPIKADITVPSKNVIVSKRPVLYHGKFVNMVMVVFIP